MIPWVLSILTLNDGFCVIFDTPVDACVSGGFGVVLVGLVCVLVWGGVGYSSVAAWRWGSGSCLFPGFCAPFVVVV